jgi:hypothetical protein
MLGSNNAGGRPQWSVSNGGRRKAWIEHVHGAMIENNAEGTQWRVSTGEARKASIEHMHGAMIEFSNRICVKRTSAWSSVLFWKRTLNAANGAARICGRQRG